MKIEHYKKILEGELLALETDLKTVGRINPNNPNDWEATPSNLDILASDENEVADSIGSYEENSAVLKQLEIELNEIKSALVRIEEGTFGICEVCKKPIEEKRLEALPEARTCIADK